LNYSRLSIAVSLGLLATSVCGQLHHDIFPSLTGAPLEQSLVNAYKPTNVLDYARARDTLFSKVYLEKDSVVCIYTQHKVYLPPGADPTQAVYLNGVQNGINTEHSYPQSKGASESNGNPYSDMHHLYPTRLAANEARADLPFKEIPDNQTNKWFYRDQTLTSTPAVAVRDLFSEFNGNGFEVRENQKGNIARSIFYFFTMYRSEALTADPLFFEAQRSTLCSWHYADAVDSLEYVRTFKIGSYQSGKPNPFVLDCSLAARTYCGTTSGTCPMLPTVSTDVTADADTPLLQVKPNVAQAGKTIQVHLIHPRLIDFKLSITDMSGSISRQEFFTHSQEALWEINLETAGTYQVVLESDNKIIAVEKLLIVR
jgi:endonuclease I